MSELKAGYLLGITTWENDGDNYNTVHYDGLSVDEATFLIKVAQLFYSKNNSTDKGFGNDEVDYAAVTNAVQAIVDEWTEAGKVIPENWNPKVENPQWYARYPDDAFSDVVYDMIGIWNEGDLYRVFDRFEVHFLQNDAKDVTSEFNG